MTHIPRRWLPFVSLLVASVAAAGKPAKPGARELERCAQSFEQGQEKRQQKDLLVAREAFEGCAQAHCPAAIKTSCARWGSELATEVPALRVELPGEASGVVVLDGAPAGAAPAELRLNPGVHRLLARTADGDGPETRVELSPGQQLTVTLEPPRPAPIASAAPPPAVSAAPAGGGKVAPLVLLGVGGVALGVGAWLGVSSWREARRLREDCAPACEASRVDTLRGRLRTADVLLGLGAVAGGVGLYLWLRKDTAVTVAPQTGGAAISTALRF